MPTTAFEGSRARSTWSGWEWSEEEIVELSRDITEQTLDLTFEIDVSERLKDLDSTSASAEWLTEFLKNAVSHEVLPWQVGEAIAEAVLARDHEVVFPWNTRRDERNPRARLQGADLVGISVQSDDCQFVFGEVKSSSDKNTPPRVMSGEGGMQQQLEHLLNDNTLRFALIKWLFSRVREENRSLFDAALAKFIESSGSSVRLVGVLVRDTSPSEDDVKTTGKALGDKVSKPGSAELHAMYMPRPMVEWTEWVTA